MAYNFIYRIGGSGTGISQSDQDNIIHTSLTQYRKTEKEKFIRALKQALQSHIKHTVERPDTDEQQKHLLYIQRTTQSFKTGLETL